MDAKAAVPLALGAGYLLGRTHKFRWALILGTAAATGRMSGLPAQAMERGTKVMQSSPELAKMAESAQKLLDAGRGAVMTAMSSRVESMGQALEGRAKDIGGGAIGAGQGVAEKAKPGRGGRGRSAEERDEYADEDYDDRDEQDEQDEYDELDEVDEEDEEEADEEAEDESDTEQPVSRGRRSTAAQGRGSAVRKARG
jgi:hypothetical protein